MPQLHFIVNPVAGSGLSIKIFSQMESLLQARGIPYSASRSEYAGHAVALTREAIKDGHDCIIAVGGDGTVREVASQMVGSSIPMSILPCGTGNDVVKALHIPKNMEAALAIYLDGEVRPMDAVEANGSLFFNCAGFGFDVDVLVNSEKFKRLRGLAAYFMGLVRSFFKLRLRRVHVVAADGSVYESNALLVEVANGTHLGGGMNVAPLADPSDGLFDVCIINDVTKCTLVFALMKFIRGKHLSLPITNYFKTTSLSVECDPPSPLQMDGEVIGQTPVTFTIRPGALFVKAGKRNGGS